MAVKQLVTEPPPEGRPMGLDGPVVLMGVAAAGPAAEQELQAAVAGGGGMSPADQGQGQQRLQLLPDYLLFMALMQQVCGAHTVCSAQTTRLSVLDWPRTVCCARILGARDMRTQGGGLPMPLYRKAPLAPSHLLCRARLLCAPYQERLPAARDEDPMRLYVSRLEGHVEERIRVGCWVMRRVKERAQSL